MKKLIVFFMACSLFSSCEKKYEECEKDCADVIIKGQFIDAETKVGLSNIDLNIFWNTTAWLGDSKPLISGKTDKLGNFNYAVSVDTSLFHNRYHIAIEITNNNEGYSNTGNPYQIFPIIKAGTYVYLLNQYSKATLRLKVKHIPNSPYKSGSLEHQISLTTYFDYAWTDKVSPKDTTIEIQTISSEYTKIKWAKQSALGQYENFSDSIKCKSNVENIFEIKF
jgi:hypothetical protein